jgi:hypothetical protein
MPRWRQVLRLRLAKARAYAQDDEFEECAEENKQRQKKLRVSPLRIA